MHNAPGAGVDLQVPGSTAARIGMQAVVRRAGRRVGGKANCPRQWRSLSVKGQQRLVCARGLGTVHSLAQVCRHYLLVKTRCGHVYHADCLWQYAKSSGTPALEGLQIRCPLCKQPQRYAGLCRALPWARAPIPDRRRVTLNRRQSHCKRHRTQTASRRKDGVVHRSNTHTLRIHRIGLAPAPPKRSATGRAPPAGLCVYILQGPNLGVELKAIKTTRPAEAADVLRRIL